MTIAIAPQRTRSGLAYFSFADLAATEFPPQEFILEPLIEKGGLYMVYGPAGLGKTWFTAGLAVAAAAGKPFLKWASAHPSRVLYIDGEMPGRKMQERLSGIARAMQADTAHLAETLFYLGRTTQKPDVIFPDMADKEEQQRIGTTIAEIEPNLIILDNLFTLCRSGDRNDARSWDGVQEFLLGQRSQGRSVVVVQHTNKSQGYFGTSAQSVVMDEIISLTAPDQPSDQGARFVVKFMKSRNMVGEEAAPIEVDVIEAPDGDGISGYEWRPASGGGEGGSNDLEDLVRLLRTGRFASQEDLGREIGKDRSTISRRLTQAKKQGLITQEEIDACYARAKENQDPAYEYEDF